MRGVCRKKQRITSVMSLGGREQGRVKEEWLLRANKKRKFGIAMIAKVLNGYYTQNEITEKIPSVCRLMSFFYFQNIDL